ncbi:MAG: hypothetical protein D6803_08505 [Anaerolineae bacterium]|nr:MAG: hypothetical protein D6803_08505 [Anaerolineae bacterium]
MKNHHIPHILLIAGALILASLACNLGVPTPTPPPISGPAPVPASTAVPTIALPTPTVTPIPPKVRMEVWSYPMLYRDGACPAPGENSLLAIAAYLDPAEKIGQDAGLELTLKMLPGGETATLRTNHYPIGKSPQGEPGFGFPLDLGVIMMSQFPNQAVAPQGIEVTYTLSLLDGNMNPMASLPPKTFMFCSSNAQDVADFRAARAAKLGAGTPDLAVWQILTRYDGAQPEGTLEITVCNLGSEVASPFDGSLAVGDNQVHLVYNANLRPGECAGVFDPASTFQFYGITQPGKVQVQASINPQDGNDPPGNNTLSGSVNIDHTATAADDLSKYQTCRSSQTHEMCWGQAPDTPKSDPHEVLKAWDGMSVIAPFEYASLANLQLGTMANCRTQITNLLGANAAIRMQMLVSDYSAFGVGTAGMEFLDTIDAYQLLLSGIHPEINWNAAFSGQCGLSNYLSP